MEAIVAETQAKLAEATQALEAAKKKGGVAHGDIWFDCDVFCSHHCLLHLMVVILLLIRCVWIGGWNENSLRPRNIYLEANNLAKLLNELNID